MAFTSERNLSGNRGVIANPVVQSARLRRSLSRFGELIPTAHTKVLNALAKCRTGELGTVSYHCEQCRRSHYVGRSCGNRHCPTCQQHQTQAWLEAQQQRLLPCVHFLVTFTVPETMRRFVRSHPKECYEALFRASQETLRALLADPKYLGADDVGMLGVLHTWGRTLEYHPHVHFVVPGGGLTKDGRWVLSRIDFLIPVKAASAIYRAKFRDEMRRVKLHDKIPAHVWQEAWVVHCESAGDGRNAVRYLSAYVFKVAISNHRIESLVETPDGEGRVTFQYKKSGTQRRRRMTLSGFEFLRRFLQHVLPSGFRKVRYYGFLTQRRQDGFELVRWKAILALGQVYELTSKPKPASPKRTALCPDCGHELRLISVTYRNPRAPPHAPPVGTSEEPAHAP